MVTNMNKIITSLVLSITAIITTNTIAAPTHERVEPSKQWHQQPQKNQHWQDERREHERRLEQQRSKHSVNPSRDWHVGQKLPHQFNHADYRMNQYQARHLPRSNKNQQWYKIKGDYVLVNERNNKIVRILG